MDLEAGAEVVELLMVVAAENSTAVFGKELSCSFGFEIRLEQRTAIARHPGQCRRGISEFGMIQLSCQ